MQTLDFTHDNNPGWLLPVAESLPEYVKSAKVLTQEELTSLPDLAFAGRRTFPIHTKEATFLSAAYLAHLGKTGSLEMETVKNAARIHGIEQDVETFLETALSTIKSAHAQQIKKAEYALEVNGQSYYPINTHEQVQDAARQLVNDFDAGKLPASWFKNASVIILNKCAALGMSSKEIMRDVANAGGEQTVDCDKAELLIQRRKLAKVSDAVMSIYTDIVKTAKNDLSNLNNYIDLIHDLDREHNIKYSSIQLNPCQIFHNGFSKEDVKKASDNNVIIAGVMVPKHEFLNIKEANISMQLGKPHTEFVMDLCKTAAVDPVLASTMAAELPLEAQQIVLAHLVA